MAVDRIHRSKLAQSYWLYCVKDPLEGIGSKIWAYGSNVTFELTTTRYCGKRRSIAFAWINRYGFPLPSLHGTITENRLGPFVRVLFNAWYEVGSDPASRLFDEAVGAREARRSLAFLARQVQGVLSGKPAHDRVPLRTALWPLA